MQVSALVSCEMSLTVSGITRTMSAASGKARRRAAITNDQVSVQASSEMNVSKSMTSTRHASNAFVYDRARTWCCWKAATECFLTGTKRFFSANFQEVPAIDRVLVQ